MRKRIYESWWLQFVLVLAFSTLAPLLGCAAGWCATGTPPWVVFTHPR